MRAFITLILFASALTRAGFLTANTRDLPPNMLGTQLPIKSQHFDPTAYLGVDPGVDLLPGIAGVDDGFNGVVDDASELGATGSDDRLVVLSETQYAADPDRLPLVLQRGAWVDSLANQVARLDVPTRQFFAAENQDGVWEWMAEKP